MSKADYKAGFVLLGVLILVAGIIVNYFSADITNMYLAVDIPPLHKGTEPYSMLQTEVAEIFIKSISVLADVGGIIAIIYGFTSKRK